MEIASFDLFTRLLSDSSSTEAHGGRIIFDTAPTGHTLRLLTLPKAWSGFLGANAHGASCIGPLAGLAENRSVIKIPPWQAVTPQGRNGFATLVIKTVNDF